MGKSTPKVSDQSHGRTSLAAAFSATDAASASQTAPRDTRSTKTPGGGQVSFPLLPMRWLSACMGLMRPLLLPPRTTGEHRQDVRRWPGEFPLPLHPHAASGADVTFAPQAARGAQASTAKTSGGGQVSFLCPSAAEFSLHAA
jgi:hypothetical protein